MLEGYITPLLMSYIDKYVKNIKPSDLKLSFWGGDAVLRNLELRLDVLERELRIPLEFKSGFIRELRLHLPWNAIASNSVEMTIKDLEFIIKLKSLRAGSSDTTSSEASNTSQEKSNKRPLPSDAITIGEKDPAPGYLQGYLDRIVNNVCIHIQNMVVKIIEEESDLMLTLNIGSVDFCTANQNWEREFVYTDYFQDRYALHKVCQVNDMTVNLHPIEIRDKAQGSSSHEPFISRCCFECRVLYEYHGKSLLRKMYEIMLDTVEISADEKQFCLFFHVLDWLLAMYYSSKKLKGRDESPNSHTSEAKRGPPLQAHQEQDPQNPPHSPLIGTAAESEETGSKNQIGNENKPQIGDEEGWGSWVWSFVGSSEGSGDMPKDQREKEATVKPPDMTKSRFCISAKSVIVSLKMTQQVQVPVFFSLRSFTSPVMKVTFMSCLFGIDVCPVTKLFLISIGIGAVKAEVMGLCPCVKKFPSSWRRASVASTTDTSEQVHVFSLGLGGNEDDTNNGTQVSESELDSGARRGDEMLLRYSLFSQKSEKYPYELEQTFLADFGKPFKAFWLTYCCRDVGPERSIEECTGLLKMGELCAAFSPDVIHRLELFIFSFKTSLEATPSFSKGMVVIGDPKAVADLKIEVAGVRFALTTCSHFLATMLTSTESQPKASHRSPTKSKRSKQPLGSSLPCLWAVCGRLSVDITQPIYSNNATSATPQRSHVITNVGGIKAGMIAIQRLGECMRILSSNESVKKDKQIVLFDQFFKLPIIKLTYNTVSYEDATNDTSIVEVDVTKATATLSVYHMSKLFFISSSWKSPCGPLSSSRLQYTLPHCDSQTLGSLSVVLQDLLVSASSTSKYTLVSAQLRNAGFGIVRKSDSKKIESFSPILYGPFDTTKWNHIKQYQEPDCSTSDQSDFTENLVEVLTTFPDGNTKEETFPTLQISISGFGMSLSPAVLTFIKQFPLHALNGDNVPCHSSSGTESADPWTVGVTVDGSGQHQNLGSAPSSYSLPYTLTPSPSTTERSMSLKLPENKLLSLAKIYAIKVKIEPILVIIPSLELAPHDSLSLKTNSIESLHTTLLTQLTSLSPMEPSPSVPLPSSPSHTSPPLPPSPPSVLILSLPGVLLESAKSHVLDEPVPRHLRADTLPWDCSLSNSSVVTMMDGGVHYVLHPLALKSTLASQQEGIALTVHSEVVTLSLSRKQVALLNNVASRVSDVTSILTSLPSKLHAASSEDLGISHSKTSMRQELVTTTPPVHATPSPPSTLPTASEASTASSSKLYQGVSSLWLQLLISKITFHLYGQSESEKLETESGVFSRSTTSSIPASSPTVEREGSWDKDRPPLRFSLEVESVSLQVDVQERCTDFIFKLSSVESDLQSLSRKNTPPGSHWVPYLEKSKGKLFSSTTSNLSDDILQSTAPAFSTNQFQASSAHTSDLIFSPVHLKSPKIPNFVYLKGFVPHGGQLHKRIKMELNLRPFEVVLWLPIFRLVLSIFASKEKSTDNSQRPTAGMETSMWPILELNVECFRAILPSQDFSRGLLLTSAGVKLTSSVDFAGAEVRLVTNPNAYRRLSLLSSEKKQSSLPVYQLEAYSVSVWGIVGNNSSLVHTILYLSNADLRVLYTPPLYSTHHQLHSSSPLGLHPPKSSLACGHSIEANFLNNFSLFIGQDQVSNVMKIMEKNRFVFGSDLEDINEDTNGDIHSEPSKLPPHSDTVPFKILITGKTMSLCLVSPPEIDQSVGSVHKAPTSLQCGMATPVLLASFHNPLCTVTCDAGGKKVGEFSLFNMEVDYNRDMNPVSYLDLTEVQTWSSMGTQVFQARRSSTGEDNATFPPSVLSLQWTSSDDSHGGIGTTSIDVGQPCKIFCTPSLLKHSLVALQSLTDSFHTEGSNHRRLSIPTPPLDNASKEEPQTVLPSSQMDIQLSTGQVLLEFSNFKTVDSVPLTKRNLSSTGGDRSQVSLTALWNKLTFSLPNMFTSEPSAAICFGGLQFLSLSGGFTEYIVPPVALDCSILCHQPSSSLDIPQSILKFSLDLLEVNISEKSVLILYGAAQSVLELLVPSPSRASQEDAEKEASEEVAPLDSRQDFKDDLRRQDFKYVVDESECPGLPKAGEIVFHSGSFEVEPTMTWKYCEPRAVSRLHVLPVPLSVTCLEETPLINSDLKVGCSLECWSERLSSFVGVDLFSLSETAEVELSLALALASCPSSQYVSRTWRVVLKHVEWFDQDSATLESTLCTGHFTARNGEQIPATTILSPLSLAASMQVDSTFSPSFLPSLSFSLHCKALHLTLLHSQDIRRKEDATTYSDLHVLPSCHSSDPQSQPLELVRVSIGDLDAYWRRMKDHSTEVSMDAVYSFAFVDFRDLIWRTVLHLTHVILSMKLDSGVNEPSLSGDSIPRITLQLKADSLVVKLSQELVHTFFVTYHMWKTTLNSVLSEGKGAKIEEAQPPSNTVALMLPNHYIICNDTNTDLKFGQMDTKEEIFLPNSSCMGYSWNSHIITTRKLHFSVCSSDSSLQWTSPFSIDTAGVNSIQVPMKSLMATAYVKVVSLEGVQKQVTIYGGWKFSSALTFALDVKLVMLDDADPSSTATTTNTLRIPPEGNVPSVLAPEGEFGGVALKAAGVSSSQWSRVYPLPNESGWNKPQLLVELPEEGQFWFNVKPMDTATKSWGHKVTFSPLFGVCSHLPFELNMSVNKTLEQAGSAQSDAGSLPLTTETIIIPEKGETKILPSFCADTWYILRFSVMSDITALSDPPISLSTFLLHHLAFSSDQPFPNPVVLFISLPLNTRKQRHCKVHATFLRSDLNTVVVDLRPEAKVINATSLVFDVVEPVLGDTGEEERVVRLGASASGVLCQNEFVLRTVHKESLLISNLISFPSVSPHPSSARAKAEGKTATSDGNDLPNTAVSLVPVLISLGPDSQTNHSVIGKAMVSYERHNRTQTATVKPTFVLQNNTAHRMKVLPCISEKGKSLDERVISYQHCIMEKLEPGECRALLFWNNILLSSQTNKSITYSLLFDARTGDNDSASWSIPLSTNFVRHSFSVPISKSSQSYEACLMTMHETPDTTYLVLQEDTGPRVCFQNLTVSDFKVVECNMAGIDASPQQIPSQHEVVYEPPSLAKLYPIVNDEDILTEQDKQVQLAAGRVKVKLCYVHPENTELSDEGEGWSSPFSVTNDKDKIVPIPGFGEVLVSTDTRMYTTFISLLPTGNNPSQQLSSKLKLTPTHRISRIFKCNVRILCGILSLIDDEAQQNTRRTLPEILRFIVCKLHFFHSSSSRDSAKVGFTAKSVRIDNMLNQSSREFAVMLLPRSEHAARLQLIQEEEEPLINFVVQYHPLANFLIHTVYLAIQPVTFQLEDSLLQKLNNIRESFKRPAIFFLDTSIAESDPVDSLLVPQSVLQESERDAHPVLIGNILIESVTIYVSANVTLRAYLSCSDTPFRLSQYELESVYSNWPEISQVIAEKYISSLLMHIGWVLGSLELIGNPVNFIESVGRGLRDLVSLPYEGLTRSPGLFIQGIGQGTASFLRQFSSGALTSITNLASSIARNMERLSMDQDHMSYQDQQRRERPATHFTAGFTSGVSSFGVSLMSAVAGLVEQPMQSVQHMEESAGTTTTLLKGVGKGLLGVVTKPVGGAMDLVSKTGQGIMHGTGLVRKIEHFELSDEMARFFQGMDLGDIQLTTGGYLRKLGKGPIVISKIASVLTETGTKQPIVLLVTNDSIYLWDMISDCLSQTISINEHSISQASSTQASDHDEIQLQVTVNSASSAKTISDDHDFEKIEQYLQLSHQVADVDGPSLILGSSISRTESIAGNSQDEDQDGKVINSNDEDSDGSGEKPLILCLNGSHALQLLAVYESLREPLKTGTNQTAAIQ